MKIRWLRTEIFITFGLGVNDIKLFGLIFFAIRATSIKILRKYTTYGVKYGKKSFITLAIGLMS
jgi:hypothetical protein